MRLDYYFPGKNEEKASQNDGTMVTVICVTYAHEEFIGQCLDSIVNQKTNFKFKVFVGEDHGPDRTAKIVQEFAQRYPNIVIPFLRKENMGSKRNMVDLIEHATSPYICFCDGDDYWVDECKLQKQFDYMEEYPTIRACFARARIDAPKDWYLNFYFKANENGERIIPDSIPNYHIYNRLLTAKDIIQFHPMHTVTVFYRWNYEIGFPDWFFYGVLGDVPLSLLQIGDGKVCFMPEVMGVYRRTNVGVHMFHDKNEHFLETRSDFINAYQGIHQDFSSRFGGYAKLEIENRLKQEWTNLIETAIKCNRIDKVVETASLFPQSAAIVFKDYCTFYQDGKAMWGTYGARTYKLLARNKWFRNGIKPFIKTAEHIYMLVQKIRHTNWVKAIFKLPYTCIFDRIIKKEMVEAFSTGCDAAWEKMPIKHSFEEFEMLTQGQEIVFCGFGPGVWHTLENDPALVERTQCIIAFDETDINYRGIPIVDWARFLLEKDNYRNCVFIVADTHAMRLHVAINYMQTLGISDYYCYSYMLAMLPKNHRLKPLYDFKRKMRELFQHNGLLRNEVLFEARKILSQKRKPTMKAKRIKELKNCHAGQTCYIVGTAPSLTLDDLELLKGKITFSVNGIYRLFKETDWRPTYYAVCDPKAIQEAFNYLRETGEALTMRDIDWDAFCKERAFLPDTVSKQMIDNQHATKCVWLRISYLNQHINAHDSMFRYEKDISLGVYNARTVVNTCINIAHYMGFKKIVLLGVDCNYLGDYQYFDKSQNVHVTDRKKGVKKVYMALTTNREMIKSYEFIKNEVAADGVVILNATRGGALEVFKRVRLEDIINEGE